MTTSIQIRFEGTSNMGMVHKDLARLRAEFAGLQRDAMKASAATNHNASQYPAVTKALQGVRTEWNNGIAAGGQFEVRQQKLISQSEAYGESLKQQKVGMMDAIKNRHLFNQVLKEQIALQRASSLAWSKDASGRISSDLIIPKNIGPELIHTRQRLGLLNTMMSSVSLNTINWGKNTQWAGRQLMTGLTLPLAILGAAMGKFAFDIDKQMTQVTKVYGDLTKGIDAATDNVRENAMSTVRTVADLYGRSSKETLGIMATLAAAGKTGNELQQATLATSRAALLGELEYQQAADASITLQTVYSHSAKQLAEDFNYINAMENQTVLTSQDFTTAIPKVSGVMQALGGTLQDTGALLTAFKAAGIDAAEGANALKTINFRLVATYGKGLKTFQTETGQDLKALVESTGGKTIPTLLKFAEAIKDLSPTKRIAVVRDVFGIYQGSKALMLLQQLTKGSDQLAQAFAVGENSVAENAAIAQKELNTLNEQPFMKIQKAIEKVKLGLADVGKDILPWVAKFVEGISSMVGWFGTLPSATKAILLVVAGLVAMAGPLIMLTGLAANLLGNLGRMATAFNTIFLRFKITDAAQRAQMLQGKLAAGVWDTQTASLNRMAISLREVTQLIQMQTIQSVVPLAPGRLMSPNSPRGSEAAGTNRLGVVGPLPPAPPGAPQYTRNQAGRLINMPGTGLPGAGKFADMDKANKSVQAQAAGQMRIQHSLEQQEILRRKNLAIADAHLRGQAKTENAMRAINIQLGEQQTKAATLVRSRAQALGGGLMGVGMIGSMVTESGTLLNTLTNVAMGVGMVSMMFPKMAEKIVKGYGSMVAGAKAWMVAQIAAGTGISAVLGKARGGIANLIGAFRAAGPAILALAVGVGLFWKMVNDAEEAAIKKAEDYGKTTETMAEVLGFAYQKVGTAVKEGVEGPMADAAEAAEKFKEANEGAYNTIKDTFGRTDGKITGDMWGEAVAQAASVKLHGGSTAAAEDAARVVLKVMGARIDEADFKAEIRARINLEDAQDVIDAMAVKLGATLQRAIDDKATGWEAAGQTFSAALDVKSALTRWNGAAGDELTAAAAQTATEQGKAWSLAFNSTIKEDQPKLLATMIQFVNRPMDTIFERNRKKMQEANINSGAELSKMLSMQKDRPGFLASMGLTEDDIAATLRAAHGIQLYTQAMAEGQGVSAVDIPKFVRPEDIDMLNRARVAAEAAVKTERNLTEAKKENWQKTYAGIQAHRDFAFVMEKAAGAGGKLSDAEALVATNVARVQNGVKGATTVIGDFTDKVEEAAEKLPSLGQALRELKINMTDQEAINAVKGLFDSQMDDIANAATESLDNEATAAIDALKASGDAAEDAMEKRADAAEAREEKASQAQNDRQEKASEAQAKRQEKASQVQSDRHDREKRAFDDAWDKRKKKVAAEADNRIRAIEKTMEAERAAEDLRQKIFEAEKTRIQRMAEMFNKNVDFNMAINSGNLDEAAKIQNDMISTQQGWDAGDAGDKSKTASEKRISALERQKADINAIRDARLAALDVTNKAEERALEKRLAREDRALKAAQAREDRTLKAAQKREDRSLQIAQTAARNRRTAEREALRKSNEDKQASVTKQWDANKKGLEAQLKTLRLSIPVDAAARAVQIAQIKAAYNKFGKNYLGPKGESWGRMVGGAITRNVHDSGRAIANDDQWEKAGKKIVQGLLYGGFGMSAAQFGKWLNGGAAPKGSLFAPKPEIKLRKGDWTPAPGDSARHDGGIIDDSQGSTTGYSRQAGLSQSEVMVRALKGEGVVSRKGMKELGGERLNALNRGLPIGGRDLYNFSAVPAAMIVAGTKNIMMETLTAVANKRLSADSGVGYAGLGAGSNNAQKVYNTLTSIGFTPQAAAGVIGNLMQESGVNPRSIQQGGPGRGIMQWSEGERFASLKRWSGKRNPWALDTQVQFMLKEMNDYGLTNRYKGMKDVSAATALFEEVMERAGTPNMPRRIQFAKSALASFGRGQQSVAGMFGSGIQLNEGVYGGPSVGGPAQTRLVDFGHALQRLGFNVAEHPLFGGVSPVHTANSWHYKNGAIDVNFDGRGQGYEDNKLNSILRLAKQYGLRTIWQYPGHYGHAHFDVGSGADLGNFIGANHGGADIAKLGRMAGMTGPQVEDAMSGVPLGRKVSPVSGKVSSRFGLRHNPIAGRKTWHDGMDIVAPNNSPIKSIANGRVLFAGTDPAYGNYTVIQHGNGMVSAYGHQSRLGVKAGDAISAGQTIGRVGSTGASTGPHLHFQTGANGKWFDPKMVMPQLRTGGYTMNEGVANLHPKELVVNEQMTKKLHDGIDQFANGPVSTYNIRADFKGANFSTDVDVERAFESLMKKIEQKNGSNRRIGNNK